MTEPPTSFDQSTADAPILRCVVCTTFHSRGHCPLKLAGAEYCNLCGLAHYGVARTCPHIRSETQVGDMLAALKQSPESRQLVDLAKKYLTGVKGTLVQHKKLKAEKAAQLAAIKAAGEGQGQGQQPFQPGGTQSFRVQLAPHPPQHLGAPSGQQQRTSGPSMPTQSQQQQPSELMQAFHQAAAQNAQNRLNVRQFAYQSQGGNSTGSRTGEAGRRS